MVQKYRFGKEIYLKQMNDIHQYKLLYWKKLKLFQKLKEQNNTFLKKPKNSKNTFKNIKELKKWKWWEKTEEFRRSAEEVMSVTLDIAASANKHCLYFSQKNFY